MKVPASWVAWLVVVMAAQPAAAHYHILLPDKPSADRDTAVTFTLRFGHPFEHQLFPTQQPASVRVVTPDGPVEDLSAKPERFDVAGADKKPVPAYRWTYTPGRRGDHAVVVRCEPEWMAEEQVFLDDTVKVVLHVQTQKGWDAAAGGGLELVPLTRPYGLRAGMVFQAQVRGPSNLTPHGVIITTPGSENQPLPGTLVEVERYNPSPPKELPPDEHVTRTVKTDPNGVATVTLAEPGWWAVTAIRDGGTRVRDG